MMTRLEFSLDRRLAETLLCIVMAVIVSLLVNEVREKRWGQHDCP